MGEENRGFHQSSMEIHILLKHALKRIARLKIPTATLELFFLRVGWRSSRQLSLYQNQEVQSTFSVYCTSLPPHSAGFFLPLWRSFWLSKVEITFPPRRSFKVEETGIELRLSIVRATLWSEITSPPVSTPSNDRWIDRYLFLLAENCPAPYSTSDTLIW